MKNQDGDLPRSVSMTNTTRRRQSKDDIDLANSMDFWRNAYQTKRSEPFAASRRRNSLHTISSFDKSKLENLEKVALDSRCKWYLVQKYQSECLAESPNERRLTMESTHSTDSESSNTVNRISIESNESQHASSRRNSQLSRGLSFK